MLFNEINGTYFKIVSKLINQAVDGDLDLSKITDIIRQYGFAESALCIPEKIFSQEWPVINKDGSTPILKKCEIPLTHIQKRWMKSLLRDPRIKLFDIDSTGLDDIEPLFDPEDIVLFDQHSDGDDYQDEKYIRNFKTIMLAIENNSSLEIVFKSTRDKSHRWVCKPEKIEYSLKDDKFRIHVKGREKRNTINIGRIIDCSIMDDNSVWSEAVEVPCCRSIIIEISDVRNTLERAMLHFSDLRKETIKFSECLYRMTLYYNPEDETEILIRVLSFGPTIKVIEPESFVELIRERLHMQRQL